MYIYNVTLNVDTDVHDDWLQWMKEVHIPDVMSTGLFLRNRVLEVMAGDPQGVTYSIQYEVRDLETLERYQQDFAPRLQKEHNQRYEGKVAAFRTILRVEHRHESGQEK